MKVWKEKETLANNELIAHILNIYILKCSYFEKLNVIKHRVLTLR
jgi:hypothetical protein